MQPVSFTTHIRTKTAVFRHMTPCTVADSYQGLEEHNHTAVAQAVSGQISTAAAWDRTQIWTYGICGGQGGTGAGFLLVVRLPLSSIPPNAPHSSSSIIRGRYNGPNSGRRTKWT
jgi:hypothetical protein